MHDTGKLDAIAALSTKRGDAMAFEDETARKKKLTSVVWETFTPMSSSGLRDGLVDSAKCNVCSKIFSTRHGTSSMMRHAKRHTEFPNGAQSGKKGKKTAVNGGAVLNGGVGGNGALPGKKSPAAIKKDSLVGAFDETGGGKADDLFVDDENVAVVDCGW